MHRIPANYEPYVIYTSKESSLIHYFCLSIQVLIVALSSALLLLLVRYSGETSPHKITNAALFVSPHIYPFDRDFSQGWPYNAVYNVTFLYCQSI